MFFQRVKTKGLGHNAYVLGCGGGLAVVVDPRRDVDEYVRIARENKLQIAYVLETHRQEDFEFGSRSLADLTGARIVAGTHALSGAADIRLADAEELKVGGTRLVALATPGHTPESMSYAVYPGDTGDTCWAVFTGDTLFVGDTGRTDLSDPALTAENAGLLHDSVHTRLAPLGPQALLLPAHGAGSACGGNISDRDDSTLGIEQATNPVFTLTRADFAARKAAEHLPRPPYFRHMEQVNLGGGRPVPAPSHELVLNPEQFNIRCKDGILIDTRGPDAFAGGHIPGAYNIWLNGLSTFGGWIADEHSALYLVVEQPAKAAAAVAALARIGIDGVAGILAEGVEAWRDAGLPIDSFATTSAREVARWMAQGPLHILDVRDDMEWEQSHIPGAHHTYVGFLNDQLPQVRKDHRIVVHCSVGHRSGLATSILRRHKFTDVFNMLGGLTAWKKLNLPLTEG